MKTKEQIIEELLRDWVPPPPMPEPRAPWPKLICAEGVIVADAIVIVSPRDPNWYRRPGQQHGKILVWRNR